MGPWEHAEFMLLCPSELQWELNSFTEEKWRAQKDEHGHLKNPHSRSMMEPGLESTLVTYEW